MTWFRVDDGFYDHRKVLGLLEERRGTHCIGLWTLCGAWASKHETDGFLPRSVAVRLGVSKNDAELLVRHGLWEIVEDGYLFHDWEDSNPLKSQLVQKRAKTAERVARHSSRRVTNAVSDAVTNHAPVPARPGPSLPIEREGVCTPTAPVAPAPLELVSPKPAKKREPAPESAPKAALRKALDGLHEEYGYTAKLTASQAHMSSGAQKVASLAAKGVELPEAAERVARAAYDRLGAGKSTSLGYALQDAVLGQQVTARNGASRGPVRAATAAEFGPPTDVDELFGPEEPREVWQ